MLGARRLAAALRDLASRACRSSTSARIAVALALKSSERGPSLEASAGMRAFGFDSTGHGRNPQLTYTSIVGVDRPGPAALRTGRCSSQRSIIGPPVVAPERLAVDDEERCAEHAERDRAGQILLRPGRPLLLGRLDRLRGSDPSLAQPPPASSGPSARRRSGPSCRVIVSSSQGRMPRLPPSGSHRPPGRRRSAARLTRSLHSAPMAIFSLSCRRVLSTQ